MLNFWEEATAIFRIVIIAAITGQPIIMHRDLLTGEVLGYGVSVPGGA